jgi:hypothetical protein
MAYTAWSVVYGEQPTAAKWNQLGANDAGFKDGTNIDSGAILNRHITSDTLDPIKLDDSRIQMGWGYITGTAATVTGPTTKSFDSVMAAKPRAMVISLLGYKLIASGVPTSASDFSADSGNYIVGKPNSASQYSVAIISRDAASNVGNNVYMGYSYLAIV